MHPRPVSTALLILVSSLLLLALAGMHTSVNPALQYQRSAIEHWHLWRLLSAHAVHLNVVHALLNITALWLIIFWLGTERSRLAWLSAGSFIGLSISLALYLWQPNISFYVGLSGVLHGLLVFGLVPLCWKNQPAAWVGLIAVIIKLCYEQIIPAGNNATEALIAGPVVSIAHIYGACSGLVLAFIGQLKAKIQYRSTRP